MPRLNALWNCKNPQQGVFPKALCICSAGLLRSPTIAWVLSNKGYNTRAVGVHDYALVPVDEVLFEWADVVFFADEEHFNAIDTEKLLGKTFHILNIPDWFSFRNPVLIDIIEEKLKEIGIE